jgi:hypothetical protein
MDRPIMSIAPTTDVQCDSEAVDAFGYELGRYVVTGSERVLCGRRVNGVAIVIDAPVGIEGRVYLVERDAGGDGYSALQALIADYLLCRRRHSPYYADPFSMPIVDGEVLHLPRS